MDGVVLVTFIIVYAGMFFGRLPGLALDRTGVALLGAIALLATGRITPPAAWTAIDVPTTALLIAMMVVSAQFRLGGFYTAVTRRIANTHAGPNAVLALVILAAGSLSAVLANDVICIVMTPLIIEACLLRGLKPTPFLLGLACGANVGSAATLIGNPQNILIGQRMGLSFSGYLADAVVPSAIGLWVTWYVICRSVRDRWHEEPRDVHIDAAPFNAWQTGKGLVVLTVLVALFLFTSVPQDLAALAAASVILTSRKMHTRRMLALVDWQLLVLFAGLFIVNHAFQKAGGLDQMAAALHSAGINLHRPADLFVTTSVLSNVVSNVPAVMLLLPFADSPMAGSLLALSSTLAGNLLIVGSIANIIVVDQAAHRGIRVSWSEHARVGIPVTVVTLLICAAWLYLRYGLGGGT
ncbi:MAG: anion transporter [Phycisphaerales bacterium]|nr:anion transporter [Phycisphaerales bacterium]